MKKLFTLMMAICAIGYAPNLIGCAACGHNHGAVEAPHGGDINVTEEHFFCELLNNDGELSLYVMDHDLQSIPLKELSLDAELEIPRWERTIPVELISKGDHYIVDADIPDRVHHYTMNLKIQHGDIQDHTKFVIEN